MKKTFEAGLLFLLGFLTRPCCVIPAALAVLGLGGTGLAATLASYRPWFLGAAAALFGLSFYWNFIRNHNRPGMVVWGLSVCIAAVLLLGPEVRAMTADPFERPEVPTMTEHLERVAIPVEGMACTACARRLERALTQSPGVAHAEVSFATKQAHVTFDRERTTLDGIGAAVRAAGFQADLDASRSDFESGP